MCRCTVLSERLLWPLYNRSTHPPPTPHPPRFPAPRVQWYPTCQMTPHDPICLRRSLVVCVYLKKKKKNPSGSTCQRVGHQIRLRVCVPLCLCTLTFVCVCVVHITAEEEGRAGMGSFIMLIWKVTPSLSSCTLQNLPVVTARQTDLGETDGG